MQEHNIVISFQDKDGNYQKNICVLLISIFENTKAHLIIHVFYDYTVSLDAINNIKKLIRSYGQKVIFYKRKIQSEYKKLNIIQTGMLSFAAMYRLDIPTVLLDVDKCLYLDGDIVVCGDIEELFNISFDGKSVLAIRDQGAIEKPYLYNRNMPVDTKNYFNSGVIMFNLKKIRGEYDLAKGCIELLMKYPKEAFADQAALNMLLAGDVKFIDGIYNKFPTRNSKVDEAIIWHFAGACKPWKVRFSEVDSLYWKFFLKTEWGKNAESLFQEYTKVVEPLSEALIYYPSGPKKMFFKRMLIRMVREFKDIWKNYFS